LELFEGGSVGEVNCSGDRGGPSVCGGINETSGSGWDRAARISLVGSTERVTCMGDANVGMMRIKGKKKIGIRMLDLNSLRGDQLLCGMINCDRFCLFYRNNSEE
jgi:hypothetical protein